MDAPQNQIISSVEEGISPETIEQQIRDNLKTRILKVGMLRKNKNKRVKITTNDVKNKWIKVAIGESDKQKELSLKIPEKDFPNILGNVGKERKRQIPHSSLRKI